MTKKKIICTVTNDLNQDQRMHRICSTLAEKGFDVLLVGRNLHDSLTLPGFPFRCSRMNCIFNSSILFYIEYNIRLFFKLMFSSFDVVNSIDLDTIIAGRLASLFKGKKFVFDAHEIFTDVPELENRIIKKSIWKIIGKILLVGRPPAYTVNESLKSILSIKYNLELNVIHNYPVFKKTYRKIKPPSIPLRLLYQGVINKGRGLETVIEVISRIPDITLLLVGTGDIDQKIKKLIQDLDVADRVIIEGFVMPRELHHLTISCDAGINFLDKSSSSHFYSSANKVYDYIMAGLPSITMNFPEYKRINQMAEVSLLVDDCNSLNIENAIIKIKNDQRYYRKLSENCILLRNKFCWEREQQKLLEIYTQLI